MNIVIKLTNLIETKSPFIFLRLGDGEYCCSNMIGSHNCDNDSYTVKLSDMLKKTFQYIINDDTINHFIGLWPGNEKYWESLVEKKVRWVDYTTFYLNNDIENKVKLFKTIKNSKMKKIIVCNPLLVKAKILLKTDDIIYIPFNNWFDKSIDDILTHITQLIKEDGNHIVMACAGMGAKVLLCELHKKFPRGIYIDLGSALDKICTKKESRGWELSYEEIIIYLQDILPLEWNSDEYNYIYEESKNKIGIHL